MAEKVRKFYTALIGGGSAAAGVFAAAESLQPGIVEQFARTKGIAWIADNRIGAGAIARYQIYGNSDPHDFVEGTPHEGIFKRLWRRGGRASRLGNATGKVHLANDVAPFLEERAEVIKKVLRSAPASDVLEGETVTRIDLKRRRKIITTESGKQIKAKDVVLATGGKEKKLEGFEERFGDKYLLSGEVITEEKLHQIRDALATGRKLVFVAASHSTYAAIAKLLDDPRLSVQDGQIVVVSKKEPLLYFASGEEAQKVGYQYLSEQVCRKTGKVNRFGGLRNDAKDVVLRKDPRVTFEQVAEIIPDYHTFQDAALIISGIGYEVNEVPIFDRKGKRVEVKRKKDGQVEVDKKGRIRDVHGKKVGRRVYGTGLGYGPRPTEDLGGELAFIGKLDGVNVQDTISGKIIARQIF